MSGALSKEIENSSKMSKNMGLSYGMIFFWRKMKWMGAGISVGDPRGTHKAGALPGGRACPPPLWSTGASPWCSSVLEILKYSIKNHTKFLGHLENFYFLVIFYCTDNSENRKIIVFLLYLF